MTREKDAVHNKLARQVGGAIACLLAAALLLGLTACGGGQAMPREEDPPPPVDQPVQPPPEETQPEPEPPEVPQPPVAPAVPDDDEHDGFPEPEETDEPLPEDLHDFTQEEFDQTVSDVLAEIIKDDMTAMEQAKAVFDYVHNNIRYISHSDKSDWMNGAYAGLTTGKGDCFNYYAVSRALLTALEIDNLEVQREGGKTQHFWNLVNCGDGWYHFDACPRSLKMPSFKSFMVTDEQVAAFTAMAGRNYYDFDGSLLPERATEIVTNTRPIPRPPEEPEPGPDETANPADGEPILPPEENQGPDDEAVVPVPGENQDGNGGAAPEEGTWPEPAGSGEAPAEEENGETTVWEEPPAEEWEDPALNDGGAEEPGEPLPETPEGTEEA